jgi:hypothetical protein
MEYCNTGTMERWNAGNEGRAECIIPVFQHSVQARTKDDNEKKQIQLSPPDLASGILAPAMLST